MTREQEIFKLIRVLLGEANDVIDNNQYSENVKDVLNSSKKLVEISKDLEKYLSEYEKEQTLNRLKNN